jgi:DNA (cytosine-5)-methyltransferase 1
MILENKEIPIIDLFAGPGGLAEGFSSVLVNEKRFFKIELSIEKEENAHKTLELRSFCRQFPPGKFPPEYYDVLKETNLYEREKKIQLLYKNYIEEYSCAKNEAWLAELGEDNFPPELIDKRINNVLNGFKNWVLIGGPPCQAYSLAGRSRVGGIDTDDKRVYLYKQYLRIIATHQPAVFVMENVKGLLSAKITEEGQEDISIFEMIKEDLRDPSIIFPDTNSKKYRIHSLVTSEVKENKDYLIKSELYGTPQKRHRVILLGIREDIAIEPSILEHKAEVTLKSVIGNLPAIRSGLGREIISSQIINGKKKRIYRDIPDSQENWELYIQKYKEGLSKMSHSVIASDMKEVKAPVLGIGSEYLKAEQTIDADHPLRTWFIDKEMDGITHHISRAHLVEDLERYLFACSFTQSEKNFPRMRDFERISPSIMPDHENAKTGKFEDRFRVQLPNIAATTVTCHISKDGHYFIHYDPKQCRSFTVREAARVQTFPDNYLFCGARTAQFHQVGNAVPPYLAYQIGIIVKNLLIEVQNQNP